MFNTMAMFTYKRPTTIS